MPNSQNRSTKSQLRNEARNKAREILLKRQKIEKRNKLIILISSITAGVAVVALLVIFVVPSLLPKAAGPGPKNMLSDGVLIGKNGKVKNTPALQPKENPVPTSYNNDDKIAHIVAYLDYMCPYCGDFEKANYKQIKELLRNSLLNQDQSNHFIANAEHFEIFGRTEKRNSGEDECYQFDNISEKVILT